MNLTRLPATVDTGRFVPGNENPPIGGSWLSSKSVNDCRLTPDARPMIRISANVGLYKCAPDERINAYAPVKPKKHGGTPKNPTGKNARKRAARKNAA